MRKKIETRIKKTRPTESFKIAISTLLTLFVLSILTTSANAVTVMPEIRKTVAVSKTDINRISCEHGKISSINYAAGTGLTHKKHENGKNVILLFQQLLNGEKRQLIDSKVNFLISCNDEYYPLILDPQPLAYQPTIRLELPEQEIEAKKTIKDFNNKTREQVLLELIKKSRNNNNDIQTPHNDEVNSSNLEVQQKDRYLGDLQLKLVNQFDVIGSTFQVKKFVVIANKAQATLTEKMFISSRVSDFQIAALSLDDYTLSAEKNWTYLHVVLDRGELKW